MTAAVLTGMAWYRLWQWKRLRELSPDSESMHESYAEWLAAAHENAQRLIRNGILAVKVDVDLDELLAWCKREGRPPDGEARAAYVLEKVQKGEYIKASRMLPKG